MSPGRSRRPTVSDGDRADDEPFLYLNRQRKHRVDRRRGLAFLGRVIEELKPGGPFSVVLVSDSAIERYNQTYRGVAAPTDVLSFSGDRDYLGDILISVETAYNQAIRSPVLNLDRNIDRLMLHGLLHLMGYDHETDGGEMRALELRLRRKFQC